MKFGELDDQNVREYWENENRFNDWLANEISATETSKFEDVLGLDIEIVNREYKVGRYQLDILAQEIEGDKKIAIESQLTTTDHDHLGKLIAYGTGVSADILIWISPKFNDEHKDALNWLNEKSELGVDFFGFELEIWKIEDSIPAVQIIPVAEPSKWRKRVKLSGQELSKTKVLQEQFWTKFQDSIESKNTRLRARQPSPQNWYNNPIGKSGFVIQFVLNSVTNRLYTRLLIRDNEEAFSILSEDKSSIENELGEKLEWIDPEDTRGTKARSKIQISRDVYLDKTDEWEEYIKWMLEKGDKFHNIFYDKVQNL